jgi:dynamin-like GTPase MGM1, mitochondrial
LELVLGKMEGLRDLNVEERGRRKVEKGKEGRKGWSLF